MSIEHDSLTLTHPAADVDLQRAIRTLARYDALDLLAITGLDGYPGRCTASNHQHVVCHLPVGHGPIHEFEARR